MVLAVADEDTIRLVCRRVLWLQGQAYDTEAYEEVRPDVGCGRCCEWGHIEAQCPRTAARCGWCVEGHKTSEHSCPVEGCQARKGHWCKHTVAKCGSCRCPHFAQENAYPKKRATRAEAPSPRPTADCFVWCGFLCFSFGVFGMALL